ncbi:DUF2012 domain-containing protein [Mycena sanguinolenta]|uniref:DUF2012 domain-containing protein n=1 Tax=Mycena sanguinolenta TaxID=230812 RepID=A0A8H7CJE7_9AGAR|nr:DUF2012 domain-containing protein [Mycena sanguinolenta]
MAAQRSPQTPSIPTRTSKGPSLLPTPARRPSFSTPGPSSPTTPAGVSGFRALRSLLPFGPNKNAISSSPSVSSNNSNGHRFASFSSVRKSVQRDRNASLSSSDLPVMVIDRAAVDEVGVLEFPPVRKSISLSGDSLPSLSAVDLPTVSIPDAFPGPSATATPSSSSKGDSPRTPEHSRDGPQLVYTARTPPVRTPSPLADLSTIIEVDTSGISKHLPSLSGTPSPSPSPTSFPPPSLPAEDTSALDLSTTHLKAQVIDAMKAQESAPISDWLETSQLAAEADEGDVSFNLSALDPDLAALLSPNRMVPSDTNHTITAAKSSLDLSDSPPLSSSSGGSRPQHQSSRPRLRLIQRPLTPPSSVQRSPSISPSTTTTSRAQTVRRAPPSPLSVSHPPSPVSSSVAIPGSPLSNSPPVTSSTPAVRRTQTTTAASVSTSRRPLLGRMLTSDSIDITSTSVRSPSNRPSLDSPAYKPSVTSRASFDTNRQRSSMDTNRQRSSIDTNRSGTTTNFNSVRERPSDRDNSTAWNLKLRRTRKRSMSVDEQQRTSSPGPTLRESSRPGSSMSNRPEWLGPRTAKAFKAAGLLGSPDSADGSSNLSPPSLSGKFGFGSVRSNTSAGRPDSRLGVASPRPGSSAGSNSGRRRGGSGSGSYFGSVGEYDDGEPDDDDVQPGHAQECVDGADDKHAVETGALLSALSDSQRTTKILREENSELRERLAQIEAESERMVTLERENQALREFVSELREEAGQLKLQLRLAAPVASSSRLASPVPSSSRYIPPTTTQAFRLPRGESPGRSWDESISEDSNPNQTAFSSTPASSKLRKRLSSSHMSNSSSVFPVPPSNMSLLLHEDGANSSDFDDNSGTSASYLASPTMVLPRLDASSPHAGAPRQPIYHKLSHDDVA